MIFKKQFSFLQVLAVATLVNVITVIVYHYINQRQEAAEQLAATTAATVENACDVEAHRLAGYKFVKPILYLNQTCESTRYYGLKGNVEDLIKTFKNTGEADQVSVYFKVLSTREYFGINENELFHPGSLIKLPLLIAYLKMEEETPGSLNKRLTFNIPKGKLPPQTYNSLQIESGKSYTIKELLKYMVAYSDNNATYLLTTNVNLKTFTKMFADLGLTVPEVYDMNYQISAKDYSVFLNVIYNAGYLNIPDSEFVGELLNECDFKDGMQSTLPADIKLVHKFGEWGTPLKPDVHQLSESGIIYVGNSTYLLTIMIQGKDVKKLPKVIGDVSGLIFNQMKSAK